MNVNASSILNVVGYSIAILIACAGIAVLVGLLLPVYLDSSVRMVLGVIMIVYGVFRGSTIWLKQRREKRFASRYEEHEPE